MLKRKYHIHMRTPLGDRAGTLEVQIEKGRVRGYLEVLKHLEPFEGSIDESGQCRISGTLVTLMRTIPYTATGRITAEALQLSLQGGRDRFPVTGTAFREA